MPVTTPKKKNRGRPLSFNRAALLEDVMTRFWEEGYANVSFNDLAKNAGLTRASLYNSFQNKETLFMEALSHYLEASPYRILDELKEGESIGGGLYSLFEMLCDARMTDDKSRGCMVVNCLNELANINPEMAAKVEAIFQMRKQLLADLLARAVQQGELPETTDTQAAANLLMTFICGFNTMTKTGESSAALRKTCHTFLTQFGFQVPARPSSA